MNYKKFRMSSIPTSPHRELWRMLLLTSLLLVNIPSHATLFYPINLVTKKGSTTTTSLKVLKKRELTGTSDSANKALGFIPATSGYRGLFKFKYAKTLNQKLDSLVLRASYRGSMLSTQKWSFSILDAKSGKWLNVGDNSKALAWLWTDINLTVPGDPTRYINDKAQVYLQYWTNTPGNFSQLDYLALESKTSPITNAPPDQGGYWNPVPGTTWQVQYSGTLNTTLDVDVYNLDLFDTTSSLIAGLHANGKRVICYLSAGSSENWRSDAAIFPTAVLGKDLDGWPGEKWLDIRQINSLLPIMKASFKLAATKGCDAVDPDNVDGYSNNTGFNISYNDQLTYNMALAQEAHKLGLAISLKNDLDQIKDLVNYFDFAVNEECFQYSECDLLKPFIDAGKPVFGIEYNLSAASFCPQANSMNFDFLKKNLSLDSARISCR